MTSLAPFISAQDLSDLLGRDVTGDPGAVMAIDAACDTIRAITEQDFNQQTSTVRLDGTGTDVLVLPQRPVATVAAVLVAGTAITDYLAPTPDGFLFRGTGAGGGYGGACWPRGRQNVTVTYDHGFAPIDLPRDIRMVAVALAMRLVVQGVAQAETIGDVTVTYSAAADDLTANELRLLAKYRAARSF